MNKASETFLSVLPRDGSICRGCSCGRTHFAVYCNEGDFNDGELESLRARAAADPDQCIEHDCSSVSAAHIGGQDYVLECPCNKLEGYEKFLWQNRSWIVEYYTMRHAEQRKVLDAFERQLTLAKDVLDDVKKVHIPE